ncbi:MAG TPA: hypothetical protein VIZ31_04510, partial [Vicinamibacteria bacterium]
VFVLRPAAPPTSASRAPGEERRSAGGDASRPRVAAPRPARVEPDWLPPPPARNIFRYADEPATPRGAARVRETPPPEATAPDRAEPPAPALWLVGFVRRPNGLRAAIATTSGVVIVGPGDVVLGHKVLSLDEDRGLRLRLPDGAELTLDLPPP